MTTTIGDCGRFKQVFLVVGLCTVGLDLFSAYRGYSHSPLRWTMAVCVPTFFVITSGKAGWLGLRLRPIQGWLYWIFVAIALGSIVLFFSIVSYFALRFVGISLHIPTLHPDLFWAMLPLYVITSPLLEELIYRLVLGASLVSRVGVGPTIIISGMTFGLLHVFYGNPAPDNLIAGFFLSWAYLKSGTIFVPIGLHSVGNLMALGTQVLSYKMFSPG